MSRHHTTIKRHRPVVQAELHQISLVKKSPSRPDDNNEAITL